MTTTTEIPVTLETPITGNLRELHALLTATQAIPSTGIPNWYKLREAKIAAIALAIKQAGNTTPVSPLLKNLGSQHQQIIEVIRSNCSLEIGQLRSKVEAYKALLKRLTDGGLMPGGAVGMLDKIESEISACDSQEQLEELLAKKARLAGLVIQQPDGRGGLVYFDNPNVVGGSIRQLNLAFLDMKAAVVFLENGIYLALEAHEQILIELETGWLALHGLPWSQTALSAIVGKMRVYLTALTGNYHRAAAQAERGHPSALIPFSPDTFGELLAA